MGRDQGVLKDSVHTLVVRVLNILIAAALGILTARLLGAGQRGVYLLPILNATLASSVFGGLNSATSYFMLNAGAGRSVLRPAIATAGVFVGAAAIVVVILGIWQQRVWSIAPAAICLPPLALTYITGGYCLGVHRVRYANLFIALSSVIAIAMMLFGLLLVSKTAGVAIVMWIAATVLSAGIGGLYLALSSRQLQSGSPVPFMGYLAFAVQSGLTNVLTILNLRVDVYIIAALTSSATLGIYTVAVSGAEALKVLTLVLSQTAAPRIGSMDIAESARFTARCIRNNILAALAPCALIIACAPWLLGLLYGAAFLPASPSLRILAIGIFASAPASVLATFYTLKLGRPMVSFWNNGLSATVCASLSVLLIPRLGMAGAAMGSTAGYIASAAVLVVMFVNKTKLPVEIVLLAQREDLQFLRRAVGSVLRRALGVRPS